MLSVLKTTKIHQDGMPLSVITLRDSVDGRTTLYPLQTHEVVFNISFMMDEMLNSVPMGEREMLTSLF